MTAQKRSSNRIGTNTILSKTCRINHQGNSLLVYQSHTHPCQVQDFPFLVTALIQALNKCHLLNGSFIKRQNRSGWNHQHHRNINGLTGRNSRQNRRIKGRSQLVSSRGRLGQISLHIGQRLTVHNLYLL
ncbi:Uncharacterised protein [Streptococcus suis]|uniref:Uncharacterized protein n=1 Tax=Streptococcus suis TaxID=1307 RepID=A0A116LY96_STRSU|nr:Uncharacterised protein [Streptococcus suis]